MAPRAGRYGSLDAPTPLAWADFPASFQADAEAFLHCKGNQDPFADDYAKSVRPGTTELRRKQILQIATALTGSGTLATAITDLITLVAVPNAKRALRFFLDRAGGKPGKYLHQQALLLKTIARHWANSPASDVEELAKICSNLSVKHTGMTEKNKTRLRPFDDPANVSALLNLPAKVQRQIERKDDGELRTALRAMHALAVELLIVAPMRADNLAGLRLDRHLVHVGRGAAKRLHLVIPAEETKNNAPFELELPADAAQMVALYLDRYHPRLSTIISPWMFPNQAGVQRSTTAFSNGICRFIRRETGLQMNLHLFRHLAVKLHLDAHPDDIETARLILGHKSATTTTRSYAETRTAAAFRRFDRVIGTLRNQAPLVAPGRTRRTGGPV